MAIHFRGVIHSPITGCTVSAPDRSIIGIVGLKGSGITALLRLAAGLDRPAAGTVEASASRRLIGFGEPLDFSPAGVLALDSALAGLDPLEKERAAVGLDRLRRSGSTILFASHEDALLERLADEIWWFDGGSLVAKGDLRDVLPKYRAFVACRLAEWGRTLTEPLDLRVRRGDGRAEIVALETAAADGHSTVVLRSHEPAFIRAKVRFIEPVENPVIGIMIRTRVGVEVYGTNTELEGVRFGPCGAGDEVRLQAQFQCALCPGEYTVTVASHDPDGTAHDWLDDAIAFTVAADRYTAGVADLRARVTAERMAPAS